MKKALVAAGLALAALGTQAKDGKDAFAACRADFDRLCRNVQPGDGRQVKCMMDNRANVNPQCGALLDEKKRKQEQWQAQGNKPKKPQ